MLYRKAPPNPPRLLLRIAATAGAGALVQMAACTSTSSMGPNSDSPDASESDVLGVVDASGFDVFGSASLPDASESDAFQGVGSSRSPDASESDAGDLDAPDSRGYVDDTGILSSPDVDAADARPETGPCNPVCGLIVHVDE